MGQPLLHAGTPLAVVVVLDGDRVRVEVLDGSARLPIRKHYSAMSGTGRGLMLVEQIAQEWGSEPITGGPGKVVWFELDGCSTPAFDILGVDAL